MRDPVGIPTPAPDLAALTRTCLALMEAVYVLQEGVRDPVRAAVTYEDLVRAQLITESQARVLSEFKAFPEDVPT